MAERNLAREWYDRAVSETDPYNKFLSIYIAFNFRYALTYPTRGDHSSAIEYATAQCKLLRFDPFAYDVSEYLSCPVRDMKTGGQNGIQVQNITPEDAEPTRKEKIKQLFEAIYLVRCNFFHGNKCLFDGRDKKLVSQGAKVLVGLMNKVLKITETR